jgi:hypothetical protein
MTDAPGMVRACPQVVLEAYPGSRSKGWGGLSGRKDGPDGRPSRKRRARERPSTHLDQGPSRASRGNIGKAQAFCREPTERESSAQR